ncbi:phosphoribosylformylglycinamidine synthase, partial [bacterium]
AIAKRERCPYAIVGTLTDDGRLTVTDREFHNVAVDMRLDVLLGKPPRMRRDVQSVPRARAVASRRNIRIADAALRVLAHPAVADKTFLITIGDRTVGGLISRDQMVGPWQVPVADVAVTLRDHEHHSGEAMAMGERTPLALLDSAAAARMAVGESVTNILAADVAKLGDIRLSANWMAACGEPGEDAALYAAVRAIGEELCPALGIAIPVGKDSLSMRTAWTEEGVAKQVTAPVSLIVSAFAPVTDVRRTLTPQLVLDGAATRLLRVDLAHGRDRLGGSILWQVYGELGDTPPDLDDPALLRNFAAAVIEARGAGLLLAYHDRSDGGLFATLVEMAFASACGLDVELEGSRLLEQLFSEELGAVLQVREADVARLRELFAKHDLAGALHDIGTPVTGPSLEFRCGDERYKADWNALRRAWSETSHRMRLLRDDPQCAREEFATQVEQGASPLVEQLSFDPAADVAAPFVGGARPRIAVLREQGVNSQVEMAAVLDRAGFETHDIHMTDLLSGRRTLGEFRG